MLPPAWRVCGLAWLALLAVLLGVYRETGAAMVAIWMRSDTYAHAFLVPPIVCWLVWRRRDELSALKPRPWPWALLPMSAAALLWLGGGLVASNAAAQLAFVAQLVLAVPLLLGSQVARALLFPLVFSFFAVPIGEFLTPTLMQWTADFTVMALRASGVPVYREGLQFVIPSGTWSVIEACSGIRYLMASFMVGSLFAYLNYRSSRRRAVFMVVSVLLPVVANWLRAYMIVMLGHLSNNEIATGADHLVYGWVFFGVVIMAMFFIGARWSEADLPPAVQAQSAASSTAAGSGLSAIWPVLAVSLLLLLLPPILVHRLEEPVSGKSPRLGLPSELSDGWVSSESPLNDWRPHFAESSAEFRRTYVGAAGRVAVHVTYYRNQNDSRKLVSSANVLVPSNDRQWNVTRRSAGTVQVKGRSMPVREVELLARAAPGGAEQGGMLVWHCYWVGGQVTTSDIMAKIYSAVQRLNGQGDESASVLVYARDDSPAVARARLSAFMNANIDIIEAHLQAVRRDR